MGDQIVVCFWLLHQIQMCPDNFSGVVYDQIQQFVSDRKAISYKMNKLRFC